MEKKSSESVSVVWCICGHRAKDHCANVRDRTLVDSEVCSICSMLFSVCRKVIIWEEPIWDDVKCVEEV